MKIGIVKPDYKIHGGFEIVVDQLKARLENQSYWVEIIKVDATNPSLDEIPYNLSAEEYQKNPDFYRYINMFWKFMKLDLSKYDVVISTQPPSFAVTHPNHISLFYHHNKIYYDLSNLIQEVGLQQPYHSKAVEVIREIDTMKLEQVSTILAGSNTIKKRIEKYNGIFNNVDVIYAGIDKDLYDYSGPVSYNHPIVVGRHEFPKRPELFVTAMKKNPDLVGRIVGVGGRTEDLKKIDMLLTYAAHQGINIRDDQVWKKMSNGFFGQDYLELLGKMKKVNLKSNVLFIGKVSKEQLVKEYAEALCVVCPAFEEDYGLTAIEAMAFKKPVVACKDGGGYTELIQDGVTGFIVEPTSEGISRAIRYFNDNPEKAIEMGQKAYNYSRNFNWDNTTRKLIEVINYCR